MTRIRHAALLAAATLPFVGDAVEVIRRNSCGGEPPPTPKGMGVDHLPPLGGTRRQRAEKRAKRKAARKARKAGRR